LHDPLVDIDVDDQLGLDLETLPDEEGPPKLPPAGQCATGVPPNHPVYGPTFTYAGEPGASTYAAAVLTTAVQGHKTDPRTQPPGYQPRINPLLHRGHLLAARFGGSNTEEGNFATVFERVNLSGMKKNEYAIARAITGCLPVTVDVRPNYHQPSVASAELWERTPKELPAISISYLVLSAGSAFGGVQPLVPNTAP
jgi:hypothetical protein